MGGKGRTEKALGGKGGERISTGTGRKDPREETGEDLGGKGLSKESGERISAGKGVEKILGGGGGGGRS